VSIRELCHADVEAVGTCDHAKAAVANGLALPVN